MSAPPDNVTTIGLLSQLAKDQFDIKSDKVRSCMRLGWPYVPITSPQAFWSIWFGQRFIIPTWKNKERWHVVPRWTNAIQDDLKRPTMHLFFLNVNFFGCHILNLGLFLGRWDCVDVAWVGWCGAASGRDAFNQVVFVCSNLWYEWLMHGLLLVFPLYHETKTSSPCIWMSCQYEEPWWRCGCSQDL